MKREGRVFPAPRHLSKATVATELARMAVLLRDVAARLARAIEAFEDGDRVFAEQVLDDLAHDLWRSIERLEREALR